MSGSRNGPFLGPKPTKACVNCRRQKMKCEVERDQVICKRCHLSQIPCIFKPRANAAAVIHELTQPVPPAVIASTSAQPKLDPQTIFSRLDTIETLLGISSTPRPVVDDDVSLRPTDADSAFNGVFAAAIHLKMTTRPPQDPKIWSRDAIKQLWLSFHRNMPGLHFLSKKKTSSTPTPLLLAAILYVSALHHQSKKFANLAPGYFVATCNAISELAVPAQAASRASNGPNAEISKLNEEQRSFQNVLGLILAGLISEAFIETAGLWITMGYRLTLDYCPVHIDERSHEWRGLFSGLQIIDLEHASLHMSCPIVPKEAPLPSLRQLQTAAKDPFYSLTQMMHTGLSHFTGRGLPTIWSFISSNQVSTPRTPAEFTATDSKVIREWARQLDDWLVQWNHPDQDHDTQMIFRQYSLHRLFVLSIYHPARGFDLFANNFASTERAELLISARATLKLQSEDKGIWSNWDLVMITWAALLVLQGIEGGVGEADDFNLIQTHLNALLTTHAPSPSLRHTLSTRLESSLQNMHTPRSAPEFDLLPDPEWAIFDASSFQLFQGFDGGGDGLGVGVGAENVEEVGGYGGMEGQWIAGTGNGNGNAEYTDAWQNTMFRIFGAGNVNDGDMGMEGMS